MPICKIFDPYPKSDRKDFFDDEEVIEEVEKLIEGKIWPLILGPKRTGKTSILKIVSKEINGIYLDASGVNTLKELGNLLINSISQLKLEIDLKIIRLQIEKKPVNGLQNLLNKLDNTVILIDEVQNIITPWFITLLSNSYNNSQVRFAFTGSMIGLSKTLTGEGKGKLGSSFKGRPIIEIEVNPFSEEKGKEFLQYGSELCGFQIKSSEIEDAVRTYRGIQGWLTYYGNFRSLGYSHEKAKEFVLNIAKNIIRDELKQLSVTQRYIINALSLVDEIEWKDLKRLTESLNKIELKDSIFNNALKHLVDSRLVKKNNNKYGLIDPIYKILNKKS